MQDRGGRAVPTAPGAGPGIRSVTLVTGDVVSVDGKIVGAGPGPGRAGMTFTITTGGDGTIVVPADAEHLLASGAVDPRLFDVDGLLVR